MYASVCVVGLGDGAVARSGAVSSILGVSTCSASATGTERPYAERPLTTIKLAPRQASHRGLSRSPVSGLVKNESEAIEERKRDDRLKSVRGIESASPGCDLKCAEDEQRAEKRLRGESSALLPF